MSIARGVNSDKVVSAVIRL